jgi:purine-cytosine permease-like protein
MDECKFDGFHFLAWYFYCYLMALITLGTLGPGLFFLGWWDSFLTIFFFNLIGMIPPAYMATFGPKMGLRAMTIPRYDPYLLKISL